MRNLGAVKPDSRPRVESTICIPTYAHTSVYVATSKRVRSSVWSYVNVTKSLRRLICLQTRNHKLHVTYRDEGAEVVGGVTDRVCGFIRKALGIEQNTWTPVLVRMRPNLCRTRTVRWNERPPDRKWYIFKLSLTHPKRRQSFTDTHTLPLAKEKDKRENAHEQDGCHGDGLLLMMMLMVEWRMFVCASMQRDAKLV